MRLTGQLLLCDEADRCRLEAGTLQVEDGHIRAIEAGYDPAAEGDEHSLLCPGFIDTHLHLPQSRAIGVHGMQLLDWLEQAIFPAEAAWSDPAYARAQSEACITRLLAAGTTSFLAYGTAHHQGTQQALEACLEHGLRAAVGQVLMDEHAPDALIGEAAQQLDESARLIDWLKGKNAHRVETAVSPRFALCCSETLMQGAGDLAAEHQSLIQTHLAEMQAECERAVELHGGPDYTSIYERAGLLTKRSVFGHGIYLEARELEALRSQRSVVAHCPLANSFLRSGTMDRHRYRGEGLRVSLGSDIGAGYEFSMIRVARAMLEAAFFCDAQPTTAGEAFWQITKGNAQALGWEQVGELRVGAEADIIRIEPPKDWLQSPNPLGRLLWDWDDRWLQEVWVLGRSSWKCF